MRTRRYIDQNYDKVAQFHPELLHCKRMACLLAIARFLHKGVLQRKASTFSMPKLGFELWPIAISV
jgi:hypothetical protein